MFPFGCAEMGLKVGEKGIIYSVPKLSIQSTGVPSGASEGLGLW